MKNTDFSAYRFPNEYVLDNNWTPKHRYFKFESFDITMSKLQTFGTGWFVQIKDHRACIVNAHLGQQASFATWHSSFSLPCDRAALRFIRLMERYSTAEYLQHACKTGSVSDISIMLRDEFPSLMRKIERFSHSIGGSKVDLRFTLA